MEGGLPDEPGVVQATRHVLRINKLSSHLPDHDEPSLPRPDQSRENRGKVVVYMDDIMIFTATIEEHQQII